jgi:hypothetical protein
MTNFDKKIDNAVEKYEKSFDKNVNKLANTAEKVASGVNRLYIGCATVLGNLFFMAFCLWGAYAAYNSYNLSKNGETTTGIVIELEESSSTEGGCCVYSPVIEFEANGQTYTFESDSASYPPEYEVGEEVRVIYNPENPNNAQINKASERWLMPVLLIPAMFFGMIIFTFAMIRAYRRNDDIMF